MAGDPGETGPQGPPGPASSLVFLGDSSACPAIGTTETVDFHEVTGASSTGLASKMHGSVGTAMNSGFDLPLDQAGIYRASLRGTWATSVSANALTVEFLFDCAGAAVLHEEVARVSTGTAGSSNVQVNIPFEVVTWLDVSQPSTVSCRLGYRVVGAAAGASGVLFHSACAPVTTRMELSVAR